IPEFFRGPCSYESHLQFGAKRHKNWVTLGSMRVLGIDCGSEYTGFGVVEEMADRTLVCRSTGAIKLKSGTPMAAKLQKIFADLTAIIVKHQPEIVAIEDVFYAVNVKTALKLGQVRGVAMLAASSSGLQVTEYSPLSIKSAVVGYGRADKHQVQQMVMRLLNLPVAPAPMDASDALAIAICHIHTAATNNRYQAASQ
ncbi:MAG TPA: crossover junction endodeoxyribonuclease RuvC, partial [Verrucomicrobiae bacterium]|nr:crossover junction endodeoxyribonuclease RuvC [Verrucomicrobiae bacterium]